MSNGNKNENQRYLGKVKSSTLQNGQTGEQFQKESIMIDNPYPAKQDGTPNEYYKGALMWFDAATGQYYQVKQIDIAGVSQNDAQRGFTKSLRIDLGNVYHVQKMDS